MAEKTKYRFIFKTAKDDVILRTEYLEALNKKQAWKLINLRANRGGWDYLLHSDSVRILFSEVTAEENKEGMERLKAKRELEKAKTEAEKGRFCPKCGKEVEYDYCQHCGWQRFGNWYGRYMLKVAGLSQCQSQLKLRRLKQ